MKQIAQLAQRMQLAQYFSWGVYNVADMFANIVQASHFTNMIRSEFDYFLMRDVSSLQVS